MEMKTAYPATLQDILFEGRNKAYGAYLLRKLYPKHLGQGLLLAIVFFVLLISLPMLASKLFSSDDFVAPVLPDTKGGLVIVDLPPQPPVAETKPNVPAGGQKNVATVKDVTPQVIDDSKVVTDKVPPRDEVANSTAGLVTSEGEGEAVTDSPEIGTGTGEGTGSGSGPASTGKVAPFISVQQMPEFEDGMAKLMEFVSKNIRYPENAKRNKIEGMVVVSFVVEPDGNVGEVTILKGLGYGTEEEALRVIKRLPRWKPGVQNGIKVPVRMTIPIRLELR